MPRKKIVRPENVQATDAPTRDDAALDVGLDDTPPELVDILQQLEADGGLLILFRRRPDHNKWDRIRSFKPSEFSIDGIPDQYGGGDYLVKVYGSDGLYTGKTYSLSFDPRIKGKLDKETDQAKIGPGNSLDAMLLIFQEQTKQANERFERTLEMLVKNQPTEAQIIEKLKALKDVVGGPPALPVEAMMTMFQSGISLAREFSDKTDGDSKSTSFMTLAEKVMTQLAEKMLFRAPGAMPPAPALPAPGTVAAPTTTAPGPTPAPNGKPPVETPEMQIKAQLGAALPMLMFQAKKQSDPELYAEVMLDNCPPAFYEAARTYLKGGTALEDLTALNADVAGYKAWFTALEAALLTQLDTLLTPEPAVDAPRTIPDEGA